jgi:hypothetical protein
MKKIILLCIASSIFCSSCGTLFGGTITECQKTKPIKGQRQIRPAAFVCDILLFWPALIVDFADGAMYTPCLDGPPVHFNTSSMQAR